MFDFENKSYDIKDVVSDAKTKGDVALWFTNHMTDSDLPRIFVKEWRCKMDKKNGRERGVDR